jgi:endonuclease YncB( thermonuclease family)
MQKRYKILFFAFVFSSIFPIVSLAAQFKVTKVLSGDAIVARSIRKEIVIRLVGIEAPEISRIKGQPGQPFSREARNYLTDLVMHKMIDIKDYGKDRYRRVLGVIYVKGKNVNLQMVKVGLAKVFKGHLPKGYNAQPYRIAEYESRKYKRGMWSQGEKDNRSKQRRKKQDK